MPYPAFDAAALIKATEDHIRTTLPIDATGHDWQHVFRVTRTAVDIAKLEGADLVVVQLAGLLHDVADWKFHDGDYTVGPKLATQWLESHGTPPGLIAEVVEIIERLSFKGAKVEQAPLSLAGRCVQDADRLDALGAIGVARAIAYGGHKSRPIFDPEHPPVLHDSFEAYKSSEAPSLNHFFEKLLLLKDRMQTTTGQRMADERHQFLATYVREFFREWFGHDVQEAAAWQPWLTKHGISLA